MRKGVKAISNSYNEKKNNLLVTLLKYLNNIDLPYSFA